MDKSIHTKDYKVFIACLKQQREQAALTQTQLAELLGETQVFVSKCERAERRLDFIETMQWCSALGIPFAQFVSVVLEQLDRE